MRKTVSVGGNVEITKRLAPCASLFCCATSEEWIRVDQSGSEWIRVDQSGSEWIRVDQSGSEWIADGRSPHPKNYPKKAGEGNRTLVVGLGSRCSTIELHPREAENTQLSLNCIEKDAAAIVAS